MQKLKVPSFKKKKTNDFWNSAYMNDITFQNIWYQISDLALNAITYEGLPETVDPRWIEYQLFYKGYGVYFNDEILGNLFLECALGGRWDVYNIPLVRYAYASNGYKNTLDKSNSVIVYNNYTHTAGAVQAQMYAYRLSNILRTMDVNVNAQKMPFIVKTTAEKKLTSQNIIKNIQGNELYVYVDDDFDMSSLDIAPTPSPYVSDKLRALYRDVWNECLTFYGYENSNNNKKERSVEAEVTSEYGWIEGQRNVLLKSRREAFEQINRMFGTDIKVKFSSDLPSMLNKSFYAGMDDRIDEDMEAEEYE